ncbi:MAG: hypothetical protein BGN86_04040 [Caulobacterales bacterium 68-7]|nr:MAG: hypothetical protein BGN86_04040 [Caulobacterales bacterium 68-7]
MAKRAGVPNGSLFTYFETKSDLLNALYLALKQHLTEQVLRDLPTGDDKAALRHLWTVWIDWGLQHAPRRKALAQLSVSDQISDVSRRTASEFAGPTVELVVRISATGALRGAPARYIGGLVEAAVGVTTEFISAHPENAEAIADAGFEALWKSLS